MSVASTVTGILRTNNTDANFRQWGANLSAQMAAAGLVKTSDGTQINWATVTTPLTGSTMQGYEIWRFADAFQSSAPVYLKIEYGSGGVNTTPGLIVAVGTGVTNIGGTAFLAGPNGSAAGNAASRISVSGAGATTNASIQSFFSGSTNRWASAMWVRNGSVSSNEPLLLSIERTKDSNGNDTAEGLLCSLLGSTTWTQWVYDLQTGVRTPLSPSMGILMPSTEQTTGVNGANTAVYPLFHDDGVGFLNPGMNFLGYYNGDITAGTVTTLSIYGSTHTYMPLGNTAVFLSSLTRAGAQSALMMRYE